MAPIRTHLQEAVSRKGATSSAASGSTSLLARASTEPTQRKKRRPASQDTILTATDERLGG